MNTADEKGSAISVGVAGKFLPQPGSALTAADLAQFTGLFRHFYDDTTTVGAAPTPTAATDAPRVILRRRR